MEFLKKNYEKIILSVVLLGLAVAAGILAFQVKSTQEELQAMIDKVITGVPKPAAGLTRKPYDELLARTTNVVLLDLNVSNKVFNPSQWRRKPDGVLVRSENTGTGALRIKGIYPLQLIVEGLLSGTPEKTDYYLQIERQYEKTPSSRGKTKRSVSAPAAGTQGRVEKVGDRVTYRVTEVGGTTPETLKIVMDLSIDGEKETVTITKDSPVKRTLGYSVELEYPLDGTKFPLKREGEDLAFAGETNNIVAIKKDSVVLSANSTGTRTYLKMTQAAP